MKIIGITSKTTLRKRMKSEGVMPQYNAKGHLIFSQHDVTKLKEYEVYDVTQNLLQYQQGDRVKPKVSCVKKKKVVTKPKIDLDPKLCWVFDDCYVLKSDVTGAFTLNQLVVAHSQNNKDRFISVCKSLGVTVHNR